MPTNHNHMKKISKLSVNINSPESVKRLVEDADRIEGDPEKMLDLVDLIFGFTESRLPPS